MKKPSFSKTILALVMASYFVALGVGIYLVTGKVPEQLYALLTFVGGAAAVAIGFYLKKAEKENTKGGITYENAMRERTAKDGGENSESEAD